MPFVTLTTVSVHAALAPSYRAAVLADSPVGYWRLGDWSGTSARDISTNSHPGVYTGSPTLAVAGALQTDGDKAVSFDGSNDWVNVSGIAAYDVDDVFSIELWLKLPALLSALKGLFGYQDTTNVPSLQITSGEAIRAARRTATSTFQTIVDSTVSITDALWHHVVWTKNGATNKLYLDGADVTGTVSDQTMTTGTTPAVGIGVTNTSVWDGVPGHIDEVALYDTELSAARVLAHYTAATAWTDLSADVRRDYGIVLDYGIRGGLVADRVASTGTLTFALRNDTGNAGSQLGWYSPHSDLVRSGWTYNIPVRLGLAYGGTTYYWRGTLDTIDPVPGKNRERAVKCVAVDFMDEAARAVGNIPVQIGKRNDEAFMALLARVASPPMLLDVQVGPDTFPYGGDNISADTKVLSGFQSLAMSGLDFIGQRRDTTFGQTVFYENRNSRAADRAVLVTLDETMHAIELETRRSKVTNRVLTTVFPRRVDAAATTVVATLYEDSTQQPSTSIGPSESVTYWLDYTDPTQRDTKIGARDQVTPVATTDYTMNSLANGTGSDLTANFTVTADFFAAAVKLTVRNGGGTAGFITKLQVRAKGIYALNPVFSEAIDEDSIRTYNEQIMRVEMPWQSDPNVGFTAAEELLALYSQPLKTTRSVLFLANQSHELMMAALTGDISDRVRLVETVTGLNEELDFHIQAVKFEVFSRTRMEVQWTLAPGESVDTATMGAGELALTGQTPVRA